MAQNTRIVEFINARGSAIAEHIEALVRRHFRFFGVQPLIRQTEAEASPTAVMLPDGERIDIDGLSALSERELSELLRLRVAIAAGQRTILFVCTGNAIRSQMAEGIVRHFFHGEWASFSAGTMPMGINEDTVKVMREIGVDLSGQFSKHVDLFKDCTFDEVVILCSDAGTRCPVFPYVGKTEHMFFDDPLTPDVMSGAIILSMKSEIRSLRKHMQKALIAYLEGQE